MNQSLPPEPRTAVLIRHGPLVAYYLNAPCEAIYRPPFGTEPLN